MEQRPVQERQALEATQAQQAWLRIRDLQVLQEIQDLRAVPDWLPKPVPQDLQVHRDVREIQEILEIRDLACGHPIFKELLLFEVIEL